MSANFKVHCCQFLDTQVKNECDIVGHYLINTTAPEEFHKEAWLAQFICYNSGKYGISTNGKLKLIILKSIGLSSRSPGGLSPLSARSIKFSKLLGSVS